MKVLLIDDIRNADFIQCTYGIRPDFIAQTFEAGIQALKSGDWDLLYLDHDLGTDYFDEDLKVPSTGYGIMCFLEANPQFLPKEITLVTSNPVGRRQMMVVIHKLYEGT